LASRLQAEIIVDEKALSNLAKMYGLKVWNTWTILLESLRKGLIKISDVESAITELGEKRHKLKNNQAREILQAAKLIISKRKANG
jgi:predicted nucleic acid-binding protein